ncbi:MAG: hypothetical protein NTW29_22290 [Bacteroidetes bacterium]|nr:hypothetical protein [Bacteroidota bacterium]
MTDQAYHLLPTIHFMKKTVWAIGLILFYHLAIAQPVTVLSDKAR